LSDVDLIKQAVDTSILLVKADGQRNWMSGIMSDLLQFQTKLCSLLGSYLMLEKDVIFVHVSDFTLQVLRG
jgi:hypothetical protein